MGKINLGRVKGNVWYTGSSYVGIEHPLHGDMFLDKNTSFVYQYQENDGWVKITENITIPSEHYYSREQIDEIVASLVGRIATLEKLVASGGGGSGETTNLLFVDDEGNESTLIFVDEYGNESQIIFEEEQ